MGLVTAVVVVVEFYSAVCGGYESVTTGFVVVLGALGGSSAILYASCPCILEGGVYREFRGRRTHRTLLLRPSRSPLPLALLSFV